LLQNEVCISAPVHCVPLYCGVRFEHVLDLVRLPLPHVTVQEDHLFHCVQIPITKIKITQHLGQFTLWVGLEKNYKWYQQLQSVFSGTRESGTAKVKLDL